MKCSNIRSFDYFRLNNIRNVTISIHCVYILASVRARLTELAHSPILLCKYVQLLIVHNEVAFVHTSLKIPKEKEIETPPHFVAV